MTREYSTPYPQALEQFGRDDVESVVRQVAAETNKPEAAVERYNGVFWKKVSTGCTGFPRTVCAREGVRTQIYVLCA